MRFLAIPLVLAAAAAPASAQFAFSPLVGYDIDYEAVTVGLAVELGVALTDLPLQPAIRPSIEYVFADDDRSIVRVDGDLIGRFEATPGILPYAKAGVTAEFVSFDNDVTSGDDSDTDIGLNLGGGVDFNRIFVEGAVGINVSSFRVRAGYRF